MHLVKEGFLNELLIALKLGETSRKESLWWFGRILGLLEGGYLTQEEHDEISNKMTEMFAGAEKTIVDIGHGDIDIHVEGQLVLHIGQVSDDKTIDLFFYPKGEMVESVIHSEDPTDECTHELLANREGGD